MKALNYNFRKIRNIALISAVAAFLFVSCGKDSQPQITDAFTYNKNMKFTRVGSQDVMSHIVFVNDSLPLILANNSNALISLDAENSDIFVDITNVQNMEDRAALINDICDIVGNRVMAGETPIKVQSKVCTQYVRDAFEGRLGAKLITVN